MKAVLFARASHPRGYGGVPTRRNRLWDDERKYFVEQPFHPDDVKDPHYATGAHGYVNVVVFCGDDEVPAVLESARLGFLWERRSGDGWYDIQRGDMDALAILPVGDHDEFRVGNVAYAMPTQTELPSYTSLGDNRAVAALNSEDFFARPVPDLPRWQ